MKLIVLAGGFGTRLSSVLNGKPKPLANINGKPFLSYLIKNWISQGVKHLTFTLHYKADEIIEYLNSEKNGILKNISYEYIIEKTPLGTGGAIANVIKNKNIIGDFFVTNSDTIVNGGILELSKTGSPSILSVRVEDISRFGNLDIDKSGFILKFEEKNIKLKTDGVINAGLYFLNSNIFKSINKTSFSIESDLFIDLTKERLLKTITIDSYFIDIGVPEDYFKFCKKVKNES